MFIHIVPRIHATEACELLDLTIKEFGLTLTADKDLSLCQPYINRRYLVACRQSAKWGAEGILLKAADLVREFTVVTRWSVAERHVAVHSVRYVVPEGYDDEHDMLSSNLPRMLDKPLVPNPKHRRKTIKIEDLALDTVDDQGYLTKRSEIVVLQRWPRREYFPHPTYNKLPQVKDSFDLCAV